jgi:hypothetical protein
MFRMQSRGGVRPIYGCGRAIVGIAFRPLLASSGGQAWIDAAAAMNGGKTPRIVGYCVASDGDLVPENVDFEKLYGLGPGGAVLVRPDGHVGYRAPAAVKDPSAALGRALDRILQRS